MSMSHTCLFTGKNVTAGVNVTHLPVHRQECDCRQSSILHKALKHVWLDAVSDANNYQPMLIS